ncbi:hypothetical protein TNCT_459791 [Trichonephila clavata]|uniref:Uncharacterized protein n=1 Tax=Trichonephila clavata TaxID=2740835 RepID=A0A8X6HTE9_TRICU|nr:hypothetical protein TNCT_459791 [Trichonephila clavata]
METTRKGELSRRGCSSGVERSLRMRNVRGSNPPTATLTRFLRGHLLFLDTWTLPDWNGDTRKGMLSRRECSSG